MVGIDDSYHQGDVKRARVFKRNRRLLVKVRGRSRKSWLGGLADYLTAMLAA
jgi:hypothetical protein